VVADEVADGREPDERAVFSEMLEAQGDGDGHIAEPA